MSDRHDERAQRLTPQPEAQKLLAEQFREVERETEERVRREGNDFLAGRFSSMESKLRAIVAAGDALQDIASSAAEYAYEFDDIAAWDAATKDCRGER